MRWSAIVAVLGACGHAAPPPPPPPPLDVPSLADAAAGTDESDASTSSIVPSIADGCTIGGSHPPNDGAELCGVPRAYCFAQVTAGARAALTSLKLGSGMSPDALVVLSGGGVKVSGMVEITQIEVRPAHATLVARLFVPTKAPGVVREVRDGNATIDFSVPEIESDAPLRITLPCDKVSTNELFLSTEDAARAAGVGRANPVSPTLASKRVDIRPTSGDAPIARLAGQGQGVFVYSKTGGRSRVLVPIEGGFVTGWINDADIGGSRGYRSRVPRVRIGTASTKKIHCDHDVAIDVTIGGRIVRAGVITARTSFDPDALPEVLRRSSVELVHGAVASVDQAALADCKQD